MTFRFLSLPSTWRLSTTVIPGFGPGVPPTMLPFALKIVWFVLCLAGTITTWVVQIALGTLWGHRKSPWVFLINLTVYQGMFLLGMIWQMDPFRMPRAFCIAQAILIQCSMYGIVASFLAFFVAANFHIQKPKGWGNIERTFNWRPIYILPVAVYPLPTDDFQCDASHPMWVRLVGHLSPIVILVLPTVLLSVASMRTVARTLVHIERARPDQNDLPRQIRHERHGEHHSSGSASFHSPSKSASSPGRQPIASVSPTHAKRPARLSFHLPFLRQLQSISQTPPPSPNRSVAADDGRPSFASSTFPTFAPAVVKPPTDGTGADLSTWKDDEDSRARTSIEGGTSAGHETPEEVELDVKTPAEAEEGAYRISCQENGDVARPRVSHVAVSTHHINQLLWFQVAFTLGLCFESLSAIIDVASHRETPTPFATHQITRLFAAWGPALAICTIMPDVRAQVVRWIAFWR
ncbi:hypothetical protein C8R44DRAFT_767901 [Mycena epipterygia]|nr:hypothetical protein C8R44DRAFT_767901 [Mycena epipterygia]